MTARRPCIDCGQVTTDTRCPDCQRQTWRQTNQRRGTFRQRGYGSKWDRLSHRARRLQPFCTDCHTTQDLQLDHLPGAWERQAAGKSLRLGIDVEVCCRDCNIARGAARGPNVRQDPGEAPLAKAQRVPGVGKMSVTDNDCQQQEVVR